MMEIVAGHWQSKEQSPLDKEQRNTGIRAGLLSLLAEEQRGAEGTQRATGAIPQSLSPAPTPPEHLRAPARNGSTQSCLWVNPC